MRKQHHGKVRIGPRSARLLLQFDIGKRGNEVIRAKFGVRIRRISGFQARRQCRQSGRVGQQVSQADRLAVEFGQFRLFRQVPGNRIVEIELALLDQARQQDRVHGLGHGPDFERGVPGPRSRLIRIRADDCACDFPVDDGNGETCPAAVSMQALGDGLAQRFVSASIRAHGGERRQGQGQGGKYGFHVGSLFVGRPSS